MMEQYVNANLGSPLASSKEGTDADMRRLKPFITSLATLDRAKRDEVRSVVVLVVVVVCAPTSLGVWGVLAAMRAPHPSNVCMRTAHRPR